MTELYFLRHAQRIDHALRTDPTARPLYEGYQPYDPSLAESAVEQVEETARDIVANTRAFLDPDDPRDPGDPKGSLGPGAKELGLGRAQGGATGDPLGKGGATGDPASFSLAPSGPVKKNVFIHFSPYLRCCQTADLLITALKPLLAQSFPNYKVRYQLLGDFALSEWIHDKMKNKPPFYDSNDAYQMYTPNIKLLKNRSACSNFRPTNTLGHWNGYDLSYKDYQNNCKEYFKKLLATYEKPSYVKSRDVIVVVGHGYLVNNVLSYFVTHPIFDEIPEGKINVAMRTEGTNGDISTASSSTTSTSAAGAGASGVGGGTGSDGSPTNSSTKDTGDTGNSTTASAVGTSGGDSTSTPSASGTEGTWVLVKDALDLFNYDMDKTLNLETDIVYYKTNFIKRDEFQTQHHLGVKKEDKPRPSFKIRQTSEAYANSVGKTNGPSATAGGAGGGTGPGSTGGSIGTTSGGTNSAILNNPICPAAKDWSPAARKFHIKNEFALKMINCDAFKPDYNILRRPSKPVSPEVSPTSEPTRNNSVIDLSKLTETDANYRPMKLKYSTTDEIPILQLNSKINSQVNLAQYQRSNPSSNNSSIVDFPKFMSYPKRTTSGANAAGIGAAGPGAARDSATGHRDLHTASGAGPGTIASPKLSTSDDSLDMDTASIDSYELESIKESNSTKPPRPQPNPLLTRSKSLRYREELAMNSGRSILAMYKKQHQNEDGDEGDDEDEARFSLSFGSANSRSGGSIRSRAFGTNSPPNVGNRPRKGSVKFILSGYSTAEGGAGATDTTGAGPGTSPSPSPGTNTATGTTDGTGDGTGDGTSTTDGTTYGGAGVDRTSTPVGFYKKPDRSIPMKKSLSIFYNLNSDSDDSNMGLPISSDDEEAQGDQSTQGQGRRTSQHPYMWFGLNK